MVATLTRSSTKSSPVDREGSVLDLFGSDTPLGFAGGDTNLMRYVGNAPTNATDPSGLQKKAKSVAVVSDSKSNAFVVVYEGFGTTPSKERPSTVLQLLTAVIKSAMHKRVR